MANIIEWTQLAPGREIEYIKVAFDKNESDVLLCSFQYFVREYKYGNSIDWAMVGHTPDEVERFVQLLEQRMKGQRPPVVIEFEKKEWQDFVALIGFNVMHGLHRKMVHEIEMLEKLHDFFEQFEENEAKLKFNV